MTRSPVAMRDTPTNYTVVIRVPARCSVVLMANDEPASTVVDGPLTLTALSELTAITHGQLSRLVRDGMIHAPAVGKERRRAIPAPEVRRVLLVVGLARKLDIPPTVLFRALHDGQAALLPDGRIALGSPAYSNQGGSQLVA
jgi:hypothetical protein